MIFTQLLLAGAYKIELEKLNDERGFFARTFCVDEFSRQNLETNFIQSSVSYNVKKGTVRGMHWQAEPHGEVKIISCVKGAIFDVLLDLRPDSPTYKQVETIELSEDNNTMLYIPEGIAHGFQTLRDNTVIQYHMNRKFSPEHAKGLQVSDPSFSIFFPLPISMISEKDLNYRLFTEGGNL
ncbi:dTDP-4-dehydrorhamnose 3,5-epimerase [soil metagenome]